MPCHYFQLAILFSLYLLFNLIFHFIRGIKEIQSSIKIQEKRYYNRGRAQKIVRSQIFFQT